MRVSQAWVHILVQPDTAHQASAGVPVVGSCFSVHTQREGAAEHHEVEREDDEAGARRGASDAGEGADDVHVRHQ